MKINNSLIFLAGVQGLWHVKCLWSTFLKLGLVFIFCTDSLWWINVSVGITILLRHFFVVFLQLTDKLNSRGLLDSWRCFFEICLLNVLVEIRRNFLSIGLCFVLFLEFCQFDLIPVGILIIRLTIFLLVFSIYALLGFIRFQRPVALVVIWSQLVSECCRDWILVQSFDVPLSLLCFGMWIWRCFLDALQIGSALWHSHVLAGSSYDRLEVIFARP